MLWSRITLLLAIEITLGFVSGRIFIPIFRRMKTGKLDFYIGDRFKKDGSEPKLGGVSIALVMLLAVILGVSVISDQADLGGDRGIYSVIAAFAYSVLLMLVGAFEDYKKDCRGENVGLPMRYKFFAEVILSLVLLLVLNASGELSTKILLPFRLGYMDLGIAYYPLTALSMAVLISSVRLNDCFNGDTESGVDGLCSVNTALYALLCAVCCVTANDTSSAVLSYCTAGAAAGYLIWGISPSKLYLGESGAFLFGGMAAALPVIANMPLIMPLLGLAFLSDGFCALLQYIIFRKSKKLLFKGNSLHSHLVARGMGDYKIMAASAAVTCLGGAAAVLYAVYSAGFI